MKSGKNIELREEKKEEKVCENERTNCFAC